jgi:hypothetical protein
MFESTGVDTGALLPPVPLDCGDFLHNVISALLAAAIAQGSLEAIRWAALP